MQKITNDLLALAQNGDEAAVAALIARMMPAIRKGAAAATAGPGFRGCRAGRSDRSV